MKVHNVAQGSEAWLKLRLGIPTASNFHKIVTPTGKLSTQARSYMFSLIAEQLLGYPMDNLDNIAWIARGKQLEPQAVEMYEFDRDVETDPVGFITTDDGRIGCTPDRLIRGHKAALELKCPAPNTHICYMVDGFGTDYIPQAQGQMYVGGFDWVDRYSYHPELPPVLHRTCRDDAFIEKLDRALTHFCDEKAAVLAKVRARGYFEEREQIHRGPGLEAAFGLPEIGGA